MEASPSGQRKRELTGLLRAWAGGKGDAGDEAWSLIYEELRRVARRALATERPDHTLQPTALVHEAYVRLANADLEWNDQVHFFAMAATAMRRILVDHAKAHRRKKRGGGAVKVPLDDVVASSAQASEELLDLDEAIQGLAAVEPRLGRLIELHYFGGLNYDEAAAALGVSRTTVNRELRLAKAWLRKELGQA